MGLAKRIIPCLDVDNGRVVKGVKFIDIRDAGDPVEVARRYDSEGADEITFLDITASSDDRETMVHVVEQVASEVFIPLTVGGGIRVAEDVRRMLNAGADKVATDGWSKLTGHDVLDLARKFESYGVEAIVYTDIGRDGMLTGPNVEATAALARAIRVPVIASGGITNIGDVRALCDVADAGIMGAITGRAIYEGTLDFAAGQRLADQLSG